MKRPATFGFVGLFLGVVTAVSVRAQAPAAPPSPAPSPPADSLTSITPEMPGGPEGYTYNPMGRRDPFVSLLKRVSPDEGTRTRRPGIEGLLIQEVALKGIVKTPKGYIAMLLGPTQSYFVGVGQRLFDGVVTAIDATTVTFRQEVTDPLSTVKSRDIKKTLYPSEEARQ
jgi:type IV pilus assembly protein PilP